MEYTSDEGGDGIGMSDLPECEEWFRAGLYCSATGRYDRAIACFSNALKVSPDFRDAYVALAYALDRIGRSLEAAEACERAFGSMPEDADALFAMAKAFHHLGRFEEATEILDRVVRSDTSHTEAWHLKGNSLYHLGRYSEALECYRRATELNPGLSRPGSTKG